MLNPKLPKIASPQQLELPDRAVLNDFAYEEPEYKKAAKAFGLETKALGGGAVALGAEALKGVTPDVADPYLDKAADWGMGVYEDQMALIPQRDLTADVERIEDIKFGEKGGFDRFTDWASYQGTKGLLDVATMVAGSGIGGAVAKTAARQGVKKAVKGAATDQLKRKAAEAGAKKVATAGKVGQTLGGTVPMGAKEGGGSYGSLVSEGVAPEKAMLPSLAVGVINASLEYIPVLSALNRVKAGFGREALSAAIRSDDTLKKKAAHIAKEALYGTASQASQEGLTESTQELVNMAAARIAKDEKLLAPLTAEEKSAYWNAMAVGGLVGGGMGTATGSVKGLGETMVKSPQERQEEVAKREEAEAKKEEAAHEERIKAAESVIGDRGLGDTDAGLREAGPDAGYEARSFVQDQVPEGRDQTTGREEVRGEQSPQQRIRETQNREVEREEEAQRLWEERRKTGVDVDPESVNRAEDDLVLPPPPPPTREEAAAEQAASRESEETSEQVEDLWAAAMAEREKSAGPKTEESLLREWDKQREAKEKGGKSDTAAQIESTFDALSDSVKENSLRAVGDKILNGDLVVYTKEESKQAALADPDYTTRELPNGDIEIIGVRHPDKGWVRQAPEGMVEEVTLDRDGVTSQEKPLDSIIQEMTLEDEVRFTQETGRSPKDVAVGEVVKETGYAAKSHIKEKMAEGYAQDKGFLDTDAGLGQEGQVSEYESTSPIKEAGIEPASKAPIKETTDLDGLSDTAKQKLDEGWEGNADVSWDASDKLNNTKSLLNAFAKGDPAFLKEQVGAYDGFYGNGTAAAVIKDLVAENQIEETGSATVTKMEVAGKLELPEYNKELHDKGWDLEFSTTGLPMYTKEGSIVAAGEMSEGSAPWVVFASNKAPQFTTTLDSAVDIIESGIMPGLKAQTQEGGMLEGEWAMAITDSQKEAEFAESWGKQTLDLLNNGANPDFVYDIASKLQEAGSIDIWDIKQGMPGGATLKMKIEGTYPGSATKVSYSPEDNSAILPTTLLGFSEVTEFTGESEVQSLFNVLSTVPDAKNKMKEIKADKELYGENALAAKWGPEAASFLIDNPAEVKTYIKALGKVPVEKWENYDEGWVADALHAGTLSGINKEGIESMVNEGFSPKTVADTAGMLDELVHLGWEYKGIDKSGSPYKVLFKTDSPSAAILYSPKTGVAELVGSGQLGGSPSAPYQLFFSSIDEAIAAYDNAGAGAETGATASTASAAAAANTEWSPPKAPPGYTIDSSKITSMDGMHVYFTGFLNSEDATAIAHIHNYFKYAKIPTIEKIQLYKEMPKSKQELEAFKVNHPYLLRKVTIGETNDVTQGTKLLHEIVSNHDKYGLEDVMQEAGLFADKFGDTALQDALKSAPKKVVDVPNLDGWLEDLRPEEDLLAENPFEGVWANYPVNSDHNAGSATYGEAGARYGVVVVNPKTGKVLLRKVSNQYEGITWDFARGGADRFSDPGPNRIDTGHQNPSKRYMEHPLIAAKREAKEEFGYDVQIVGQLAKGFYSGREGKMASLYYVGVPTGEQSTDHLSGPHQETDATQWASLPEARRLVTTQPTLGPSQSMKRDGYHRPRIARIARTLEAVFDSNMQKSDLGYRGNPKAMQAYRDGDLATDFPAVFKAVENKPKVEDMTETQKIKLSSALYVARRHLGASKMMLNVYYKQEFKKRNAALNAWIKSRIGETGKVSDILSGGAAFNTIKNKLQQTNGKIVLSLWHGSKDREALLGDVIDPQFFGSGVGGSDTKEGMFLASTRKAAKKWARARQVNVLVAFENLKVIPNDVSYGSTSFTHILQQAKADGYDGVFFNKVHDAVTGRQIVVWKGENVIAGGGENVGFTGKTLYQTKGELGDALDLGTATELLREDLGPITDTLLKSGMLELVESGGPDGVAGQYDAATDTIKVYLDYVSSPRELLGAVLHEGSHARLVNVLGKSAVKYHEDFLKQEGSAADARYKTAWEGAQRFGIANALTPENTSELNRVREELRKISPDFLMEEDLANYVQFAQGKDEGLFRRIVNAVKAWWAATALGKSLKQKGLGFAFTDGMAVALVKQGLRNQADSTSDGLFNTYIAHTSGAKWKAENKFPHGRPLLKYVLKGQGEGNISYGWGFYALESQATMDYYKQGVGSNTYGMHVPDDIVPKMIEWDRPLNQQSPQVQRALLDPRDDYLLLRLALKAKDKTSTYPTSPSLEIKGTGSSFYSELTKYYMDKEYGGMDGYIHDPETGKQQRKKNMARRMASRKLAEYGLAGMRLLDAGSRVVYVRKNTDGTYEVRKGIGHSTKVSTVDQAGLEKEAGKHIAEKAAQQQIGETVKHPGFGFYNWVFWRQEDLDRLTVVYKEGQKVAGNPKKNAAYDVNGVGLPYPEHPGVSDYVVDPKTGDQKYYSKEGRTMRMDREELVQELDKEMGQGWVEQAEAAGLVEIVNEPGPNGESGSWDGQRIRLYAGSMPVSGGAAGVLLHEGKHATFKDVLGDSLNQYVGDLHTMAEAGNELARRAMTQATLSAADSLGVEHFLREEWAGREELDRVRREVEQRSPGLLAEEDLAYFVQYGAEGQGGGLFRRLMDQLKAWWASTALGQMLKEKGIGFELTEGMAVIWAQRGLHGALNAARGQAQQSMAVNREAAYMSAAGRVGRALEAAFSGIVDSTGKPVHQTEEGQARFKEWFSGSKVVDEQGRPKVVYHYGKKRYAEEGITQFEPGGDVLHNEKRNLPLAGTKMANRAAIMGYESGPGVWFGEQDASATGHQGVEGTAAYPAYLNLKNPLVINSNKERLAWKQRLMPHSEGRYGEDTGFRPDFPYRFDGKQRQQLEQLGYDGIILNVEDPNGGREREWIAFEPEQVKSAIGNTGDFDGANAEIHHSMASWDDVSGYLWTDPTDGREDQVNKPGLLQRIRADFIDYFAEMEAVDTGVYDVYSLVRNKKAARLEQLKQEYALPLRSKIADSPWSGKETSDMLAARHVKVDGVNRKLAERASDMYAKRLLKKDVLPEVRAKELSKARGFVRVGKNPDGTDHVDAQGNQITMSASTKRKLMFDLVNYYIPYEIKQGGEQLLRNDWEVFKDAASGFSDGGVGSAFVRTVDQVLNGVSANQGKWDEITNLYDSLNRMTLDILEDGGLITADEKARLMGDKTAYAPLRREAYNLNDEIQKIFQQAGAGGAKQLATRAGTETLSEPVMALQNALAKAEAAAAAAERNYANNRLYETINQDREGWKSWFAVVDKDKYATHDENGFLVEKKSTAQNKSDIVLLRGGKKLIIRPNAHNERALGFVRAVNNLDAQVLNGPMRVMNWLNGIVRWVNVSASPAFLMMNAVRDPFTAAYNMQASEAKEYTSEIFANYGKTFTALKKVFVQGIRDPADADVQMVERWERAGGRTSFIESLKEMDDSWGSFEAQISRRQGGAKALFEMKDKWLDGIENTNILFENVMRLSTFTVLVDKRVSDQRAARISQDLTTNFTRRGYKTQALGVWWLFFNATVQGNYQVVRNLMASKKLQGITAGTIGLSLMLDVMGRMMFDDWDEIPEWDKERFIIAPVKVGGDFVKIPAPWVYNVVWRMGGLLGETLAGKRKPQDMLLDLSAMTMTTFNPVGSASLAQAISPTAMDPFVQILENKDFAGNPLAPEGYPGVGQRPNAELAWGSTPEGYKWLAEYVNEATGGSPVESGMVDLRPADYKVLVNFLTGSLGRFLTDTTLGIKDVTQGELELEGPKDVPLVGGLFADPSNPMRSEKYHTRVASAYGAAKLEKMYKEGPERDLIKLMEVRRERAGDLRIYKYAQDVERQIKEIRKKVKRAEGRGDERTVEIMRGRIDRLKEQFNRSYEVRVGK